VTVILRCSVRSAEPRRATARAVHPSRLAALAPQDDGESESSVLSVGITGDLKGFWSVSVSANWRIIFRFEGTDAVDIDLIDYH
jgi:hypothetical protein